MAMRALGQLMRFLLVPPMLAPLLPIATPVGAATLSPDVVTDLGTFGGSCSTPLALNDAGHDPRPSDRAAVGRLEHARLARLVRPDPLSGARHTPLDPTDTLRGTAYSRAGWRCHPAPRSSCVLPRLLAYFAHFAYFVSTSRSSGPHHRTRRGCRRSGSAACGTRPLAGSPAPSPSGRRNGTA